MCACTLTNWVIMNFYSLSFKVLSAVALLAAVASTDLAATITAMAGEARSAAQVACTNQHKSNANCPIKSTLMDMNSQRKINEQ